MVRATWKAVERKLAEILGGERVPVSGRSRGSAPDIAHPFLSIEVKARQKHPALLVDAYDQASKSKRGVQLPIVILHQQGQRHENDFVVFRLADFLEFKIEVDELLGVKKDEQENS
jgi:hypothetical protein